MTENEFFAKAKELAGNIAEGAGASLTEAEKAGFARRYLAVNGMERPSEERMVWLIAESLAA